MLTALCFYFKSSKTIAVISHPLLEYVPRNTSPIDGNALRQKPSTDTCIWGAHGTVPPPVIPHWASAH